MVGRASPDIDARRQAPRETMGDEVPASLEAAREAVDQCRRCPLFRHASQGVFGEGPKRARVMFVGEQPGDQEDEQGRPFVGPAGRILNEVIDTVGIDRSRIYVTNAVKHFKFVPRGKRRIHQRPDAGEIQACKFWLDLEISLVRPEILVALGVTAARSLLGKGSVTIGKLRGAPLEFDDGRVLFVTNHPSYLLRIRNAADRMREREKFAADLTLIRQTMAALEKS